MDEFASLELDLAEGGTYAAPPSTGGEKNPQLKRYIPSENDVCFFNEKSDTIDDLTYLAIIAAPSLGLGGCIGIGVSTGSFSFGLESGISIFLFTAFFLLIQKIFHLGDETLKEYWFFNSQTKKLTFAQTDEQGVLRLQQQKSFSSKLTVCIAREFTDFISFHDEKWRLVREIPKLKSRKKFEKNVGIIFNEPKEFEFNLDYWSLAISVSDPFLVHNYTQAYSGTIREQNLVLLRSENDDEPVWATLVGSVFVAFVPLIFMFISRKVLTVNNSNKPLFWSRRRRTYLDANKKVLIEMREFSRGWVPSRLIHISQKLIKKEQYSSYDGDYTVYELHLNQHDSIGFGSDQIAAQKMLNDIQQCLGSTTSR